MTVAELMAVLAGFDPAMRVVVDGYEGGLDDVLEVDVALIRADANLDPDQNYYGRHLVDKQAKPDRNSGMAQGAPTRRRQCDGAIVGRF